MASSPFSSNMTTSAFPDLGDGSNNESSTLLDPDVLVTDGPTTPAADNSTESSTECDGYLPFNSLLLYLSLASAVLLVAGSFWRRRTRLFPTWLSGRPGLLQPMDTLSTRVLCRLPYAAAFGLTGQLCLNIFSGDAVPQDFGAVPPRSKAAFSLVCVIIYGIALYPIFGALYLGHWLGHGVALLYVLVLFSLSIANTVFCARDYLDKLVGTRTANGSAFEDLLYSSNQPLLGVHVSNELPVFLCELALAAYLGWQLVTAVRTCLGRPVQSEEAAFERGHCYVHVKALLAQRSETGEKGALQHKIRACCYQPVDGYRYPMRLVATFAVAVILIYMLSFQVNELAVYLFNVIDALVHMLNELVQLVGDESVAQEVLGELLGDGAVLLQLLNANRLDLLIRTYVAVKASFFVSQGLALATSLLMMALAVVAFRNDMLSVYRGDYSKIPRVDASSNGSLMVGSLHYSGYQIAYVLWGFIIHWLFLFLLCIIVSVAVVWSFLFTVVLYFLNNSWPAIVLAVVLFVLQTLVGRYVFLQEGKLALNNRRFYFNLLYFMFFYNILLGFVSCLLRILKGAIIGVTFLSRLDQCSMPRRFEMWDPGFSAYVGFVHIENAHTNPCLVVFCHLLTESARGRQQSQLQQVSVVSSPSASKEWKRTRNRFQVAVLLAAHPELVFRRKRYLASKRKPTDEEIEGHEQRGTRL